MEFNNSNSGESARKKIPKAPFHFIKDKNGLILSVHHTIECSDSRATRIRLATACFSSNNTLFVAIDYRGNIFVFDLAGKKYWKLPEQIRHCSVIENDLYNANCYIFGTKRGYLNHIDIEIGRTNKIKKLCTTEIRSISFPCSSLKNIILNKKVFIVHTKERALLVDIVDFNVTYKLEYNNSISTLKFITFIPNIGKILSIFTNDTIHIWSYLFSNSNLNSNSRILYPMKLRNKYINSDKFKELNFKDSTNELGINDANDEIKDLTNGLINSYSFSLDGQYICLSTIDNFIIILSSITFDLINLIKLKNFYLTQCCCLTLNYSSVTSTKSDNKKNDLLLLGMTSSSSDVVLIDCSDSNVEAILQKGNSYKMKMSSDGKLVSVILKTGEINVFQTSKILNVLKSTQNTIESLRSSTFAGTDEAAAFTMTELNVELKKSLNRKRLLPILTQFGFYTAKYRYLIWSTILLDLPSNKIQFCELLKKGTHPQCYHYDTKYTFKDVKLLRNYKKIMSCLYYWTGAFSYCDDWLSKFIFPFIQIFTQINLLQTFEMCATIIYNYCQLWFEFIPMIPYNYLGIIENLLDFYDPKLLQFFKLNKVTSEIYSWSLLSTAFSEVLDDEQWLQLWDNILTNDVDYIIYCVLAFLTQNRSLIMRLTTIESIEDFFHEQSAIYMKQFLKKVDILRKTCPDYLNPNRYLKKFQKLPNQYYPKFENYPKKFLKIKNDEDNKVNQEYQMINKRIENLEREEFDLVKRLENRLRTEEEIRQAEEYEKTQKLALLRETERVEYQRKTLLAYEMEIRNRKAKIMDLIDESEKRKKSLRSDKIIEMEMRNCETNGKQTENEILMAERDLKDCHLLYMSEKLKK